MPCAPLRPLALADEVVSRGGGGESSDVTKSASPPAGGDGGAGEGRAAAVVEVAAAGGGAPACELHKVDEGLQHNTLTSNETRKTRLRNCTLPFVYFV